MRINERPGNIGSEMSVRTGYQRESLAAEVVHNSRVSHRLTTGVCTDIFRRGFASKTPSVNTWFNEAKGTSFVG